MSEDKSKQEFHRRDFIFKSAAVASIGILAPAAGCSSESDGTAKAKNVTATGAGVAVGNQGPFATTGLAAMSMNAQLSPMNFERRALGAGDVAVKVAYCGICHTDVHAVRGFYAGVPYSLMPGHESSGVVIATGKDVTRVKVGDQVAVGVMTNSCNRCKECGNLTEQFCENGAEFTYGAPDGKGSTTNGAYSTIQVAAQRFVYPLPKGIDLQHAAPLMCAGSTMFSALRHWKVASGMKIAVVGLGGLGHVGVMMAKAMGAEVTVITTTPQKEADARAFGATDVLVLDASADFSKKRRTLDALSATAPERFEFDRLIPMLKRDATYVRVGSGKSSEPNQIGQNSLIYGRNAFAGTGVGGTRETDEMLAFCAKHSIKPKIQVVPLNGARIGEAFVSLEQKTAQYRYVIDVQKS